MSKNKQVRGTIIDKIGHFRIYQKNTETVDAVTKKSRTTATDISIYNCKTLVKGGFKNKVSAIAEAQKLLQV